MIRNIAYACYFAKGKKQRKRMKRDENTLTRSEFQIMSILWDINRAACGKEILERFPEPKPTYTTIATFLKILYEKGFVDFFKKEGEGKTQWYMARVSRQEYTRQTMRGVKKNFFDDSLKSMFSFFLREEHLTEQDVLDILNTLKEEEL